MCRYFLLDEIPQPHTCQNLTLALSACKSLLAAVAAMSRVVISHLQNCLSSKAGAGKQLGGAGIPREHFPVLFSFQKENILAAL